MMKAWWVQDHPDADWGLYVHAGTRGQAKAAAMGITPSPDSFEEWNSIIAYRVPCMDDKPFTHDNLIASGIVPTEEGEELSRGDYWLDCRCDLCRAAAKEGR